MGEGLKKLFTLIVVLLLVHASPTFAVLELLQLTPAEISAPIVDPEDPEVTALSIVAVATTFVQNEEEKTELEIIPDEVIETEIVEVDNTPFAINGPLLNYPNPFSISKSSTRIGYKLTQDADIKLEIYSVDGYKIYERDFVAGQNGGNKNYNRIEINRSVLGNDVSPGVYYYVLIYDGSLLAKSKMVVVP